MRVSLFSIVFFLGSCTFIAADVDLTPCHSHAECNVLNGEQDPGYFAVTTCQRWQCTGAILDGADRTLDALEIPLDEGVCVFGPLDVDNDGAADAACRAEVSGPFDCDDRNALSNDDGEETCDGVDNDCDGLIDEAVVGLDVLETIDVANRTVMWSESLALLSPGESMGRPSIVGLGGQGGLLPDLDLLQFHLVQDDTTITGFSSCLDVSSSCSLGSGELADRGGRFAPLLAFVAERGETGDLLVGTLEDGVFTSVFTERRSSVGIASSNVSPAVDRTPVGDRPADNVGLAITQGGASSPSVAILGDERQEHALLAYHQDAGGLTQLLGLLFGTEGGVSNLIQGTNDGHPVSLGASVGAPTVLAVGDQGWLVSDATGDAIRVYYVPAFSGLVLEEPSLLTEVPTRTGEVAMALRSLDAGQVEVGLVWATRGEIRWSSFVFDPAAPAAVLADAIALGTGASPTLSPTSSIYRGRENSSGQWLVGFVQSGRLALARVGDGALVEPAAVSEITAVEPTFVQRDGELALYARTPQSLMHVAAVCGD